MTDDPWRKPDLNAPVPPPSYGPMPYGPPGVPQYDPANPYAAPLPKRGGYKRLLWILGTVGLLVLGGCGVGIYLLAKTVTQNADEANAFLRNVRAQQFTAAYQHLCPSERASYSVTRFTAAMNGAVARGHGLRSFDITSSNTSSVAVITGGHATVRTAGGTVTFVNGAAFGVTFTLEKQSGHLCILAGYSALF